MAGGSAIRGSRIGAGPLGEAERGEAAPRKRISYFCGNGHHTTPALAVEAEVPDLWDCPRCGAPAGQDSDAPPALARHEPYKTHLAYVEERRSEEDGEAILAEALERLRAQRRLVAEEMARQAAAPTKAPAAKARARTATTKAKGSTRPSRARAAASAPDAAEVVAADASA